MFIIFRLDPLKSVDTIDANVLTLSMTIIGCCPSCGISPGTASVVLPPVIVDYNTYQPRPLMMLTGLMGFVVQAAEGHKLGYP